MSIQSVFLFLFLACMFEGCRPAGSEAGTESGKPNILFLFADDFTYEAVHALGNQVVRTPNLDRLAAAGVTFTHAYNMGGWHGAICVASRSMIISGASIWKAKQTAETWGKGDTAAINRTWGNLMAARGYRTYMSGKWHVQAPVDSVFQVTRHVRPGGMPGDYWSKTAGIWQSMGEAYRSGQDIRPLMPLGYNRPLNEEDDSWSAADTIHGGYWEGGRHWSEVLRDDAIGFLADAATQNSPFFMYLAFNAPHDPRQSPQSFLDLYPVDSIPLPKNWLPEYPYKDSIGNTPLLRDEALAPYPRTPFAIRTHIREYYAIITHLDEQIGKILDALEASGMKDNTYIFFTGDHGLSVGHHGLLGKQSLFDHSIRVPLIAVGPDLPKGKKVDTDVYLQDIMATSLDLAGIQQPAYVDFNSLTGLAKGTTTRGSYEDGIYGAYMDLQRMIRKDGFKLLIYPKLNKIMLFDLEKDPLEMENLAEKPEYAATVKSLFKDLLALQNKMGDELDLKNLYEAL